MNEKLNSVIREQFLSSIIHSFSKLLGLMGKYYNLFIKNQ